MSSLSAINLSQPLEYPDDDGHRMSDNTRQFQWIVTLQGNLDSLFQPDPNVFVAGDLLWYPVEGHPHLRAAPDTMVVFGRPKGYRGSYKQWCENNIAPQVAFEVLSPGNRPEAMDRKFVFYERFGVEEYYIYDPDTVEFYGFRRVGANLESMGNLHGKISPRLGVRFDLAGPELVIYDPSGKPFLTFLEWREKEAIAQRERETAQQLLELERLAKEQAQRRANEESLQRREAQARADVLAARLRELGIDPDQVAK